MRLLPIELIQCFVRYQNVRRHCLSRGYHTWKPIPSTIPRLIEHRFAEATQLLWQVYHYRKICTFYRVCHVLFERELYALCKGCTFILHKVYRGAFCPDLPKKIQAYIGRSARRLIGH
jgi:hypothetical protein